MGDTSPQLSNRIRSYFEIIRQLQDAIDGVDSKDTIHMLIENQIAMYLGKIHAEAELIKDDE